jgi:hypothetical protein
MRIKIDLGDRYEKTSQSEQGSSVQTGPGTLDQEGSFMEGEGGIRNGGCSLGVPEPESEVKGTRLESLLMQGLFEVAYW